MASIEPGTKPPSPREQHWRKVIDRWQASGQTVRAFCTEHRLSEPSFYSWRRTLTLRDQRPPTDVAVPPSATQDEPAALPAFVPVRVVPSPVDAPPPSAGVGLELAIGSHRVVRVPPGFDVETLRRLLTLLEESPSC